MSALSDQDFYTDKQLRERWHCSHMKLYRLRAGSPVRAHVESLLTMNQVCSMGMGGRPRSYDPSPSPSPGVPRRGPSSRRGQGRGRTTRRRLAAGA